VTGYVRPQTLLDQVRNTAPFLFGPEAPPAPAGIDEPLGFLALLQRAAAGAGHDLAEYFALCLACHHATVATFVPTDVDSKIRGLLWRETRDRETLRRMFSIALAACRWEISPVSKRATALAGLGPVSGHNGEQMSVLAGALGAFLRAGDTEYARRAGEAIEAELEREAAEFRCARRRAGCELDLLRISASLTHNAGDLDQGISFWPRGESYQLWRDRFGRLAHENARPFQGAFQAAAAIYKRSLAPEGHRHYPLRGVKALRRSASLLLPLGPFFDDWGALVATHPGLGIAERAETVGALIGGCRKIPGQRGYYRALAGFAAAYPGRVDDVIRLLPASLRGEWKNPGLRRAIAVPRPSFESMMRKLI
jgi:hypothetical protein